MPVDGNFNGNGNGWSQRAATDPRLAVASRIGVLLMVLFFGPLATWTLLQTVDHGDRLTRVETKLAQVMMPPPYSSDSATKDFALRDSQIVANTEALRHLIEVVGILQQRQADRIPLFDQAMVRLDRLEAAVFGRAWPKK